MTHPTPFQRTAAQLHAAATDARTIATQRETVNTQDGPDSAPALTDARAEFPGLACFPSTPASSGCMAIRTGEPDHPVPEQYTHLEAHTPAELSQPPTQNGKDRQ